MREVIIFAYFNINHLSTPKEMRMSKYLILLAALIAPVIAWSQEQTASVPTEPRPARAREIVVYPDDQEYPAELVKTGVQGTAFVLVAFNPDGTPVSTAVRTTSRSDQLDEIALSIVRKLSLQQTTDSGTPRYSSVLVPVKFSKDVVTDLGKKSCEDLNVDLAYFRSVFPQKKSEDLELFSIATGALFLIVKNEKRMPIVAGRKTVISKTIATCAAEPERKFFEVMLRAADEVSVK